MEYTATITYDGETFKGKEVRILILNNGYMMDMGYMDSTSKYNSSTFNTIVDSLEFIE